ncbi:MAG TPA: hypothetical protein VNF47_15590 [Streptosporangiaceae bacterium]|nr:hypothetical protein [Streptosporangiaceae bacterium]
MIVVLGLIVLAAAVAVGAAGVLGNGGSAHLLTHGFAMFGYHVTGSAGTVFLAGIAVGAVGLFGLALLMAGARRGTRRRRTARHKLQQSRRETAAVSQDRDDLTARLKAARNDATGTQANGEPQGDRVHAD